MQNNSPKPNEKQQECIDKRNGKFLVLAGPGTGKTFTVSKRIKEMINKDKISPKRILCLTFSNTAVNEMKQKINKELDTLESGVIVSTYHSFCKNLIDNDYSSFELSDDIKIINDQTSRALVKECIEEFLPTYYMSAKNDPYCHMKDICNGINEIKARRYTKETYFKAIEENPDWEPELHLIEKDESLTEKQRQKAILAQEKRIGKARELWQYYEMYQKKMDYYKYIDFSDLISMVLDKFENDPMFLKSVAKKYDHILVDEFQDTNLNQNRIVELLASVVDNVFVVGDDDQIIFSFQGARLDTMHRYIEKFDPQVICLSENRRSSQNILDASRIVSSFDNLRLEGDEKFVKYKITKELKSVDFKYENEKIRVIPYIDSMHEKISIVEEIKKLKEKFEKENKKLSEIAIIAVKNSELAEYAQLLKNANIPFELKEEKSIFEIRSVIAMIYYMQLLTNPEGNCDKILKLLLLEPFNIHPWDFDIISNEKSNTKCLIDYLLNENLDYSSFREPKKIKKFVENYKYLKAFHSSAALKDTLLTIGARSGIFEYYINSEIERSENILGIKRLIEEAQDFFTKGQIASLEDFVEYLEVTYSQNIAIKAEKSPVSLDAVQLTTYHSSKGREFEYVYMPNLIASLWEEKKTKAPSIPVPLGECKNEQQREQETLSDRVKNFFVGMTRAKHSLTLSYPRQNASGTVAVPSEFVLKTVEIAKNNNKDIFEICEQAQGYSNETFSLYCAKTFIKESYNYKKDFKELIKSRLPEVYSPSAIKDYLTCPRQFLYSRILNLDPKSGNADRAHFGTAVHNTLKYAFDYAKENNKYWEVEKFIETFNLEVEKLSISTFEVVEEYKELWKECLYDRGFYAIFISTPPNRLEEAEFEVLGTLKDGTKFRGIIDRIEKNDEENSYSIFDYKTIDSKTIKTYFCPGREHEDYYNQIGLYKILYEKQKKESGKNIKVENVGFIYPKIPNKPLTYELSDEEAGKIEDRVIELVNSIKNLEFEPLEKQDKEFGTCSWCPYGCYCGLDVVHGDEK